MDFIAHEKFLTTNYFQTTVICYLEKVTLIQFLWYANHIFNCLCISTKGPPLNQQFEPFYYVIAGDTLTLNCTATNNPGSPAIIFLWYKNSEDVTHLTRKIASDTTSQYIRSTSQLYIYKLDSDQHSGRYICVANYKVISTTTVIVES